MIRFCKVCGGCSGEGGAKDDTQVAISVQIDDGTICQVRG